MTRAAAPAAARLIPGESREYPSDENHAADVRRIGRPGHPRPLGPLAITREAAGIVVITVRRLERSDAMVVLGSHVMSPSHLPTNGLEERVAKVLRNAGVDVPLNQRIPAMVP